MADLDAVLDELTAEGDELDALVAGLTAEQWVLDTPAKGWTIATQIAHLAWTDDAALLAITDPPAFQAELQKALQAIDTFVDEGAAERAQLPAAELLAGWRDGRARVRAALREVPDGMKIAWFGPPMSAASMATARLMETYAHGQDVADALGVTRPATSRLRSIAHIGVRTRDFAYLVRDLPLPAEPFRVELTGPAGEVWAWGPEDAAQRVSGPALDFCLLVTQRRHRDDTALVTVGDDAAQWLTIAQAFAGPPGPGRERAA